MAATSETGRGTIQNSVEMHPLFLKHDEGWWGVVAPRAPGHAGTLELHFTRAARRALYMAALVATCYNLMLKTFYQRCGRRGNRPNSPSSPSGANSPNSPTFSSSIALPSNSPIKTVAASRPMRSTSMLRTVSKGTLRGEPSAPAGPRAGRGKRSSHQTFLGAVALCPLPFPKRRRPNQLTWSGL